MDDLVTSLNDYVERQKKQIAEENERLLHEGRETFERLITERRKMGPLAELEAADKLHPDWPRRFRAAAMDAINKAGMLKDRGAEKAKDLLGPVVRRGKAWAGAVRRLLARRS